MRVDLQNAEAVSEIEELMARFGLSAETVIERVIIDAGCWMPMETLADSHWVNRKIFDPKPSLPVVEKNPLPFAKDWDVKVISDPPHFELTHNSGFVVSQSVYDNWVRFGRRHLG